MADMIEVHVVWPSPRIVTGILGYPSDVPGPIVGRCPDSALARETLHSAQMVDDDMQLAWAYPDRFRAIAFDILSALVTGGDPVAGWDKDPELEAMKAIESARATDTGASPVDEISVKEWLYKNHPLPGGRVLSAFITSYSSHGVPFLSARYKHAETGTVLDGETTSYNSLMHAIINAVASTDAQLEAMMSGDVAGLGGHIRWYLLNRFSSMWE